MNNLFSVFDPQVEWLGLSLNWVSSILVLAWLPSLFWVRAPQAPSLIKRTLILLAVEFKANLWPKMTPGHTHWALGLFTFVLLNNMGGITPYTFSSTRHLSVTVSLALSSWLAYWGASTLVDTGQALAHLVPVGTPYILIPLIVLIELVRSLIRPLTLSVRLAANIVAGHLLITLVSSPLTTAGTGAIFLIFSGLILLIVLESAVAFIQAYVFRILRTLYLGEANTLNLNYLCNSNFLYKIYLLCFFWNLNN